ncbi:hypothetical protein DPMN_088674 [Dreissena polymorpha]|uniref:Uncharacterized protein n=1 Tax=Dreissena polymorpha TaxID=45954 RepID=A0A9D4QXB4_DREPO|nr:hypothetical protein DPMN_088674 [Dreissena polymorpha]
MVVLPKFVSLRSAHDDPNDLQIPTTSSYLKRSLPIDDSFPNALFAVDNYHLLRADRTASGGGVMAYLRSDIAGDRPLDLDMDVSSLFLGSFRFKRDEALEFSTAKLQRPIELQLLPKFGQRMELRELRLFLLFRSNIASFI